jgi:guanylate kinase
MVVKLLLLFVVTSRAMKHGEINGKEYFFVSREKMEEDVEASKFVEFGEYKGNLYGTSAESVKSLINAGYVCILNPHYQVCLFVIYLSLATVKKNCISLQIRTQYVVLYI